MAEKRIKFRLFHYYEEIPALGAPGQMTLAERQAHFGETVDIVREEDLARGEALGAFFTDEELKAIEKGGYEGPEADQLRTEAIERGEVKEEIEEITIRTPAAIREPEAQRDGDADQETADLSEMSEEDIAQLIVDRNLNVQDTVKLAGDDPELASKVMDAEVLAGQMKEVDPRAGVDKGLQTIIDRHVSSQGDGQ